MWAIHSLVWMWFKVGNVWLWYVYSTKNSFTEKKIVFPASLTRVQENLLKKHDTILCVWTEEMFLQNVEIAGQHVIKQSLFRFIIHVSLKAMIHRRLSSSNYLYKIMVFFKFRWNWVVFHFFLLSWGSHKTSHL